ncbi:MAG: hypothetical protein K0Q48_1019 [Bacillota bacterium]|jgi:hypothetical protein|nr:hypothetical protein [Bacillota bacterium]
MGRFVTDPECILQREFVNIPAWHKAGHTGKGLTVFCDDVQKNHHAELVKDIVQTILPEARVLSGAIGYAWQDAESMEPAKKVIVDCAVRCTETAEVMRFDDFIKKYEVSLINNSTDGGSGTEILPQAVYMNQKIQEHNLIFCGAAGNGYGQPTTQKYNGACMVVTSVKLEEGKPIYGLKAHGENLDFSMFYGFQSGTSNSSPFLLGMVGLLRCRWPEITQAEAYAYLKEQCVSLGPRKKFGWGIPVLGEAQ